MKRQAESVETLQRELEELVLERQRLRVNGTSPSELEENRRAIARRQHDLSLALIARYAPLPAA
jgi:coenzyme F420-reducing hydrogenase delta subunit